MKRFWMCVTGLLLVTMACSWGGALPGGPTQPSGFITLIPTRPAGAAPATLSVNATVTAAPRPTRSPTPTPVPIPTRTPITPTTTPLATPEGDVILIEYLDKYFVEAPAQPSDAYAGINLPRLVIYTNGQVIWRDDSGALMQSSMTDAAMCTLLRGIQTIGFFKAEGDGSEGSDDPIYEDIPQKYLDITDSTSFLVVINGSPSKWVEIYRPYVYSLVRPVKSTWELFNSYVPSDLRPYDPELYALWVEPEPKLARKYGAGQELEAADWPADMTRLSRLLGDSDAVQLALDAEGVAPILSYFNPTPGVKVFKEGQNRYSVILRPLLPHETMANLSPVAQEASQFGLPFECKK